MKNKIIISILIVVFGVTIISPPAYAEVVTVSIILAAAFTSVVVTSEAVKYQQDVETAATPGGAGSMQASADHSTVASPP
jgi:ABC-type spermidine/putrescine transport system permease subunit II